MFGCGTGRHFSFVFLRRFASLTFLFGLILLGGAAIARAQTETVLHSFVGFPTDVYGSSAALTMDSSGNLYGAYGGGAYDMGAVYEFVKTLTGYHEELLYNFGSVPLDASDPNGSVIMDSAGNLYGTTTNGGGLGAYLGAVFELIKSSTGYSEKVLYKFSGSGDAGDLPTASLVMDSAGNLYGTTRQGSPYDRGAVFELINTPTGYTEKTLLTFTGTSDGGSPVGGVILDSVGNLYGLAGSGGANQQGVVYELVESYTSYTEKVLYNFAALRGAITYPVGNLTLDSAGNLYGTTLTGGANGNGTVYELVKSSGGYMATVLYNFSSDEGETRAGVTMDSAGNLYGTLLTGSGANQYGSVYKLVKSSTGYTFRELWSFQGMPGDGYYPWAGLIIGPAGNLYGTTELGGTLQKGTLFKVNPNATRSGVTLSPSNVDLGTYLAGTTSPPQALRLTNYTSSTLGLSSVWISGSDASDFAVALSDTGTNCSTSTSVAPGGGTCATLVNFTPSIVGNESATLIISDSAGAQTVNLTGTGFKLPDFTLDMSSGSSSSETVKAGSTAQFSLTLTPEWGFASPVFLTCGGAPLHSTCTVTPPQMVPDGTDPVGVTVSVATSAPALAAPRRPDFPVPPPAVLWLTFLDLLGLCTLGLVSRRGKARLAWLAPLAVVLLTVAFWASCGGGGGSGSSSSLTSSPGTPAGTYTLTVTAASDSVAHSTTLTLNVK